MQIQPSIQDPDRSCRVACQDEYLLHRFYLVNGDYGLFPFGTKCSPKEKRYCVNGKCLVIIIIMKTINLKEERNFDKFSFFFFFFILRNLALMIYH